MRTISNIKAKAKTYSLSEFLASSDWFQALPELRQSWLATRILERHVEAGGYLAPDGQVAKYGYTVLDGLLVWSVCNADGDEISLGALLSGSWFGHATLFGQQPRRGHVIALRESTVACMSKEAFDWLMANSILFNNFLLRHMFARTQWLMGTIASRATASVEQQVARAILGMIDPEQNPGASLEINVSQEELGRIAGYSRQRCCAAVKALRAQGIVETAYCDLSIPDPERLRSFVLGESQPARLRLGLPA